MVYYDPIQPEGVYKIDTEKHRPPEWYEARIEELLREFNPGEEALKAIQDQPPHVRLRALQIARTEVTEKVASEQQGVRN